MYRLATRYTHRDLRLPNSLQDWCNVNASAAMQKNRSAIPARREKFKSPDPRARLEIQGLCTSALGQILRFNHSV